MSGGNPNVLSVKSLHQQTSPEEEKKGNGLKKVQ